MFNFEDSELTLASLLGESSKAGDKRSFGKKTVEAKRRKNVAVQTSLWRFSRANSRDSNGYGGGPYLAPTRTMKLISWNYRSLRRPAATRDLKALRKELEPSSIFLVETK